MRPKYISRILSAFILAFILSFVNSLSVFGNPIKKTIISGTVINLDESTDPLQIQLITYKPFILDANFEPAYLNEDGRFNFEFEQLYPIEISIRYEEVFIVYAFPGDSITITIDADFLKADQTNKFYHHEYYETNCSNKTFQSEYLKFHRAFYSSQFDQQADDKAQTSFLYTEYKEYIQKKVKKYNTFLSKFNKTNGTSNEFQEWASNWIQAGELYDLMEYRWRCPYLTEVNKDTFQLPLEYYTFLKDSKFNNERMLASNNYTFFLHYFNMYHSRSLIPQDLREKRSSLYKSGEKVESLRIVLTSIIEKQTGFIQEFLLAKFYSELINWKLVDEMEALYDPNLIGRQDYITEIEKQYAELMKHVKKPMNAAELNLHEVNNSDIGFLFPTLPTRYPDKVIYVDFWATWCGPCLAEMPQSKKLQEEFYDKDVVFVFLANRCTEKSWKATLSERKLTGEHYLLSDEEFSALAGKFDIVGIPRYMIIDKRGMIINDKAPRPSDESLAGILKTLNEK